MFNLEYFKSCGGIVLVILAILVFMKNCTGALDTGPDIHTALDKTVVVNLTTKVDTVYVKKFIHIKDIVKVPTLIKADTVFIVHTNHVATIPNIKRQYSDSVKRDSITITYFAQTHGTLDNISLDFKDYRAEKTIIRTITKDSTTIITKHPGGLFIGIGSNLGLNELSPHVQYVNGRNIFGVKYNLIGTQTPLQNVGLTYSRQLF